MVNRLRHVRNQLLAFWKWCLSFRKTDWCVEDYPIALRKQGPDASDVPLRGRLVPYLASIVNWNLVGSGETAAEALADLERNFTSQKSHRLKDGESLPRPGTHVPIQFATKERIERHRELADDFIRRVLELEWAWISDDSSLWDFHTEETNEVLVAKTKDIYGVDISDIQSGKLCEIFERIVEQDKFRRWL